MTESVRELLEKSVQTIGAAELLVNDGYADFPAGRAYYAMFYAVEALLLSRELSFSKHSAIIAAFGKDYVKAGLLDSRFHRYLLNAFDLRNAGDYGAMHIVSEEKARQTIVEAREFLDAITLLLDSEPTTERS